MRLITPIVSDRIEALTNTEIPDGVSMVGAPRAWDDGVTGKGVVIAVLDTGCAANHPDLIGRVIGGRNFTNEGSAEDYSDNHGHGTHVTGTIAAIKNGLGVAGVAPGARILPLKVLDKNGHGMYASIVNALDYARQWRGPDGESVRIVSMSLGGPTGFPRLHQAVKDAVAAGILVICAAGNDGDDNATTDETSYPGGFDEVVTVGAADWYGHVAPFSDSNNAVDLVAPGVDVKSTYNDGTYRVMSGTSMATPHASGVAALIVEQWERDYGRTITEAELYAQMIRRCGTLDADRRLQGAGLINVTFNYAKPAAWESLTFDKALDIAQSAVPPVLDTPQFWRNMIAKYNSGGLVNDDFRYVELAFRKFAGALK